MHLLLVPDADAKLLQAQSAGVLSQWLLGQLRRAQFDLAQELIYRYIPEQHATMFLQYETDAEMVIPATRLQAAVAQKRQETVGMA